MDRVKTPAAGTTTPLGLGGQIPVKQSQRLMELPIHHKIVAQGIPSFVWVDKGGKPPPALLVKIREGVSLLSLNQRAQKTGASPSFSVITLSARFRPPVAQGNKILSVFLLDTQLRQFSARLKAVSWYFGEGKESIDPWWRVGGGPPGHHAPMSKLVIGNEKALADCHTFFCRKQLEERRQSCEGETDANISPSQVASGLQPD